MAYVTNKLSHLELLLSCIWMKKYLSVNFMSFNTNSEDLYSLEVLLSDSQMGFSRNK